MPLEPNGKQLITYGYSILDYAREYDQQWINYIDCFLQNLFRNSSYGVIRKLPTSLRHLFQKMYGFSDTNFRHGVHVSAIPDESLYLAMSYLDDESLIAAWGVNRKWNALASSDDLWDNLLKQKFSVCADNILCGMEAEQAPTPKQIFFAMREALRMMYSGDNAASMGSQRRFFSPVISSATLVTA